MPEPRDLTLLQAAALLRRGKLSATALVESCLERIRAREPAVHAWASLHAEEALKQARALDRRAQRGAWAGPLHGIPVGIKDIYDVAGMETRAGTAAYTPRVAGQDAASVSRLRRAGAIVLGKTETTAFAFGDPAPTRNPWNLGRTPGGSSSGSAAGVADGMCLAALGSQTAGSVLRPASYCGVVGFKPTFKTISLAGVIPLAWSLDHVGCFTRDVQDANLLWQLLRDRGAPDAKPGQAPRPVAKKKPRRLWRIRGLFESEASAESLRTLDSACRALAQAGAQIVEMALPPLFDRVLEAQHTIMACQGAAYHESGFASRPQLYPPRIAEIIREGQTIPGVRLAQALRLKHELLGELSPLLAQVDAALTPTTVGPAPTPETTGPRVFQAPWSFCGVPTVTLPAGLAPDGLPLGIQLVGGLWQDDTLLRVAAWCEGVLQVHLRPS